MEKQVFLVLLSYIIPLLQDLRKITLFLRKNFFRDIWVKYFIIEEFAVNPGGPVVIILATGSEVHRFKPSRGRWIFSEHKNPEHDFLRRGPGGSSGKALDYGLDGLCSILGVGGVENFLHSFMSRLALGSTQPPIK